MQFDIESIYGQWTVWRTGSVAADDDDGGGGDGGGGSRGDAMLGLSARCPLSNDDLWSAHTDIEIQALNGA